MGKGVGRDGTDVHRKGVSGARRGCCCGGQAMGKYGGRRGATGKTACAWCTGGIGRDGRGVAGPAKGRAQSAACMCYSCVIRGRANGSVGSTEKGAYLSVRASRGDAAASPYSFRFPSALHPHRPPSRRRAHDADASLLRARLAACLFTPSAPSSPTTSLPTQLLPVYIPSRFPRVPPLRPLTLALLATSTRPTPTSSYCVLPGEGVGRQGVPRACRGEGRVCVRYIRSFRACVREAFV